MKLLDKIPLTLLIVIAVFMGLAPFVPQPHLLEKLTMLVNGQLTKPLDMFDLAWHSLFPCLLILKLVREHQIKAKNN